ncbi:MAG: xanthine dehydrogenase family protein subunit M [Beijerinckiaceae bacterium]|nr:xanthine dehydrogenase family protein subunit M [Beijerinckiaceae bacterium]
MKLPQFDYQAPASLSEAVALLAAGDGQARPISGGQSFLPIMAFRLAEPTMLVDLRNIPDLRGIEVNEKCVRIGAMTRWRDILDSAQLKIALPLLPEAIEHVAHYQVRNRGTIGGSLAHADPAAEMPALALALDAVIETVGAKGKRDVAAGDLFTGPLMTSLEPDEIIVAVRFPAQPRERRYAFEEFARRRGDFALAGVAVRYDLDAQGKARDVRASALSVADTPVRLTKAEAALEGRSVDADAIKAAQAAASGEVDPAGDIHASARYRKALVGTLLGRALERASTRKAR